ncbi:MAG: response regulator [Anaerolineae bacterium]|nr:response regulator [Anaerolineae bacterium]
MAEESIRILLIEDNPGDARLLRELMAEVEGVRFQLTHVDRLSAGLTRLAEGDMDVILLDLSLPDSQGPDTLTRLQDGAPGVPIVVLTGLEDESLGMALVQAGAQDYLVKGQVTGGHFLLRSMRYAIERQRTEAEIIRHNRELLTLQRAGAAIASSLDLQYVLDTVTREMATLLEVEGCAIYEWHQANDTISKVAEHGPATWKVQRALAKLYRLAELPLTRRVLFERQPQQMTLSQPQVDPAELAYLQMVRLKTRLMLPLEFQDRVIGLAEIEDSRVERTFSEGEIGLVQLLANQAASAIENARLYAETGRRARQLAVLHELDQVISANLRIEEVYHALALHASRLFSYNHMSITLLEGTSLRLTYVAHPDEAGPAVGALLPLKALAAGWVVTKGQPLLRHQIPADRRFAKDELWAAGEVQADMIIPVRIKGQIIGTWNIGSHHLGNYGPDDLEVAQLVADQLAIAIDNARLYARARQEIAERQRAEAALQESEKRFRSLIENSSDAITLFDVAGVIRYASPSIRQILGYDLEEFVERRMFDLIHLDDLEQARAFLAELTQKPGGTASLLYRMQHKDGSWRWLEGVGTNLLAEPSIQAIVGNHRDVTERRKLEEQLQQSQKMEAVGRLAGGVAHDFNNLLLVITGYSELLLDRYLGDNERVRGYVKQIHQAGDRAAALTRQLLVFSRKQMLEPKVLDLNEIIAEMDKLLRRLIGEDIDLVTIPKPGLGQVKADPSQIEQIIMNLAVNARDAMPQGGKLTIETANVELDEAYTRQHADVSPGPYVLLAVSDTGIGMDQAVLAHIFEPFFTTKEEGKGTGLGLATVYGIVKQSSGHIWTYSEVGHGTTFKIYLPRIEETVVAVEPGLDQTRQPQGSETILLVEDADPVREMLRTLLQGDGYTVLEARSGAEALQLYAQHAGSLHLLVTDMVMPGGLNGRELAERLASLHPGLKILFVSGYTDEAIVHHGVLEQGMVFLQKPFSPATLLRKVREVLESPLASFLAL